MGSELKRALSTAFLMAVWALLLPFAAGAIPMTYAVSSGGIRDGNACLNATCTSAAQETFDYASGPIDAMTGTLTLDTTALTLGFELTVGSLILAESVAGTDDNGVAQIVFSGTTYSASGVTLLAVGPTYVITGGTGTVAGTILQLDSGGGLVSVDPFSVSGVALSGMCNLLGGALSCSQAFGRSGFALGVGAPGSQQDRFFRHDASVVTSAGISPIPEPAAALLYLVGLLVVGTVSRRASAACSLSAPR